MTMGRMQLLPAFGFRCQLAPFAARAAGFAGSTGNPARAGGLRWVGPASGTVWDARGFGSVAWGAEATAPRPGTAGPPGQPGAAVPTATVLTWAVPTGTAPAWAFSAK